jgi:hypothetical protein
MSQGNHELRQKIPANSSNIYKNYNDIVARSARTKDTTHGHKNRSEYGMKIDKNMVKDSGPAKTLETLNKSIEKNSHIRSFTITTMAMGGGDFSCESTTKDTNNFSSNS